MKTILKKYNLLVSEYQDIEKDISQKRIRAKRVILSQLFALLTACKTDQDNIRNGKKAYKLFSQVRDIQVRLKLVDSAEPTPLFIGYSTFLKEHEIKLERKIRKFCKKKKLIFPTIEKKAKIKESKIYATADKLLDKFIDRMESQAYVYVIDIEKIRKRFSKFKYMVDTLSYISIINDSKLEKINVCEKKLDEMYNYDVLIKDLSDFNKKYQLVEVLNIDIFEKKLIQLFDEFDNNFAELIVVCKDVIGSMSDNIIENIFFKMKTVQPSLGNSIEVISSKA